MSHDALNVLVFAVIVVGAFALGAALAERSHRRTKARHPSARTVYPRSVDS